MTSPKETIAAAQAKAERHAEFIAALEGIGKGRAREVICTASLTAGLKDEIAGITEGEPLETWKRETKARIIAAYLNARGFTTTYEAVCLVTKPKVLGGFIAKEWGQRLAPAGANDLADWQDACDKGSGLARVKLTTAFADNNLDISTGLPKVKVAPTQPSNNVNAGQCETASATTPNFKEIIKAAPPADLIDVLGNMPPAAFSEIVFAAARHQLLTGAIHGGKISDEHFANAIVKANGERVRGNAVPAAPCGAPFAS